MRPGLHNQAAGTLTGPAQWALRGHRETLMSKTSKTNPTQARTVETVTAELSALRRNMAEAGPFWCGMAGLTRMSMAPREQALEAELRALRAL